MKYEETNHKIYKTYTLSEQQRVEIGNLNHEIKVEKSHTRIHVDGYINNKFVYESEWQNIEEYKDEDGNGVGTYRISYTISFAEIPLSFLPFIKYQMLYSSNDESIKIDANNVLFLIKETYEGETAEESTLKVDMIVYFEVSGESDGQIEGKIYLNIANPDISS